MTQLLLPLEPLPQELLRLPLPLAASWWAAHDPQLLEELRWQAQARQHVDFGQWLVAMPAGTTTYDTARGAYWYKGQGTTWVQGDTPAEARERHDSWVAAGCPNPRRDCQPSMPGYRTREAREARAAARAAEKEKRTMDRITSTSPDQRLATWVVEHGQDMDQEVRKAYLRKPSSVKLCSGAPSLGVEPHAQLRSQFASDSTPDGLYRMCKPCDSVTQRAYRIRLRLRAQGQAADNRTVRAILETHALMPKSAAALEAQARQPEPAPAPEPARVPQVSDPVVVLGVKYRIKAVGPQSGIVQLRTSYGGRVSSCKVDELSWDKVAGLWRVENGSAALAVAQVAPATRPAPKPSKSTPEQRARWAEAKRQQRAAARSR